MSAHLYEAYVSGSKGVCSLSSASFTLMPSLTVGCLVHVVFHYDTRLRLCGAMPLLAPRRLSLP